MKILELFSGTASVGKEFKKRGHELFTVDNNAYFNPKLCMDIMEINADFLQQYFPNPEVIWASPPCQAFSVSTVYRNFKKGRGNRLVPVSQNAMDSIERVKRTLNIIEDTDPDFWFIENPRGMLRKMGFMQKYHRRTITYCQYGDRRMKPTDIWGNRLWELRFKVPCKSGGSCHQSAPRGSRQGTQGLKNAVERGKIPPNFGRSLCVQIEEYYKCIRQDTATKKKRLLD